jgi:EAL domain-containing protein (putative c-di-GMP-specific phosphodiesterase class I)
LPIDGVKIDKSFISRIEEVNYKKSILSSIISLVKKMNLDAIVEGVEEESQLRYLEECSCTKAQGYLFSKPIPITELHTLFDKKIII